MRGEYAYTAYGLVLRSNRPLPGLVSAVADAPSDVRIDVMMEQEPRPPSAQVEQLRCGARTLAKADGVYYHLWFRGDGRLDFELDAGGTRISARWTRSVLEEVTALLAGQVLGCALRLRGFLCLHACALKVGGVAIALVGNSGRGKSTAAAAFAGRGYPVLSDDIAVLDDRNRQWRVLPGYPRLRLWPDVVKALYGPEEGLARIFSFSEKRFVDLANNTHEDNTHGAGWRFQHEPLPLAAIYLLGKRQAGLALPTIEPVRPAVALGALMACRAIGYLPLDSSQHARELTGLGRVVTEIPTRRLICGEGLDALPRLCDAVVADLAQLPAAIRIP